MGTTALTVHSFSPYFFITLSFNFWKVTKTKCIQMQICILKLVKIVLNDNQLKRN